MQTAEAEMKKSRSATSGLSVAPDDANLENQGHTNAPTKKRKSGAKVSGLSARKPRRGTPDVRRRVRSRIRKAAARSIPMGARAVLDVILKHAGADGIATLSVRTIAKLSDMCRRNAQYVLRALERRGWLATRLRKVSRNWNEVSVYQLLPCGKLWEHKKVLRKSSAAWMLAMGAKPGAHSDPSSIAPSAVAAVGLSEGSAEGAAVDDVTVSDEPAGLESGRSFEGGEEGSAAEPSVDDVLGIAPGEETQRNSPLPDGDGAPSVTPPAPQEAAQEQPAPRPRRRSGASPLATARAHARVAFALRVLLSLKMDEQALTREARQLWTVVQGRGVAHVELFLCALSALSRQRAQAMLSEDENLWKRNDPSEVAKYLGGTFKVYAMPTYTTASGLHWEGDPSCPWKAEHDAAVARGDAYGEAPPAILPRHDPYKRRPFRDHLRRAVDHSHIGAQVDEMPDPSPSIANECARLILSAFAATYHDVRSLADLADDVVLANRLAQRSEAACAGGTLTTEDVLAVVRHFGTIQAFDQKRTGIAKAGPQLTSYLSKQLRAAKRGCAATLTLQTKAAKYIEVKPKISTAQPSGGLAHLTREKKRLTPEEITALRESVERKPT